MADKESVKEAYETGKYTIKKLSEKFGAKENTIKSWKNRDRKNGAEWKKKDATGRRKDATKKERVQLKKAVQEVIESGLSEKQKLYCIFRGMGHSILQASLKAGYSKTTAYTTCYEMDKQDLIRQEVKKFQAIRYAGIIHGEKDLILQWSRIGFADIGDYLEEGNNGELNLKPLVEMDTGIIKEITIEKDLVSDKMYKQKIKFKLEDKIPALRALGEANNMFKQQVEHSGKIDADVKTTVIDKIDKYEGLFNGVHKSETKSNT